MKPTRGKLLACATGGAGALVAAALVFVLRDRILPQVDDLSDRSPLLPRTAGSSLGKVFISSGTIALSDFAMFLGDYTGLPVFVDPKLEGRKVTVSADIKDADAEVVRALLRASGFRVRKETIPGGSEVLRITPLGPPW